MYYFPSLHNCIFKNLIKSCSIIPHVICTFLLSIAVSVHHTINMGKTSATITSRILGSNSSPRRHNEAKQNSSIAYGNAAPDARHLEVLNQSTKRGLKSRHAQMIALGGTIGTGLFVGSGATLARGGPAFILICYIILTALVFFVITAVTEVAVHLPLPGGTMSYFGFRYVSSSLGFAMSWLYWYSLGILVPYEITAAGLVIDYWNPPVHIAVWITIFIIIIVGLNFFPVSVYGETEFWFASTKITMMVGLLILSFVLFWGGGSTHRRLGFHYWKDPGPIRT